jgi:hypothetical protein
MMFAVTGQGACMAILAGTVWDGGHAAGLVATVMLFLFNFFFAVGLLAIPWLRMFSHKTTPEITLANLLCLFSARRVLATCDSNSIGGSRDCNQLYDAL